MIWTPRQNYQVAILFRCSVLLTWERWSRTTMVGMNKYDSLTNFLLDQPPGPVSMTFTKINTLLGFCIPAPARKYQSWWDNETARNTRHRQCRSWLNAN